MFFYPLPLKIKCPYGLNQPYHPTVIYEPKGLFGHQYWMAVTPYPIVDILPYRDRYETPCVYYSDDGFNWLPINNPIDELTEEEIRGRCYFSDPHLVVREETLELFYRFCANDNIPIICRKFSRDGVNWSERECLIDLHENQNIFGNRIISPAFIWTENNGYECWYVDDTYKNVNRKIRYTKSTDGYIWENSVVCELKGDIIPWHIDVQKVADEYNIIVYDVDRNLLDWYVGKKKTMWYYKTTILRPSGINGSFLEKGLYRACSINVSGKWYVYFSAHNGIDSAIGVLETNNRKNFRVINCQSFSRALIYSIKICKNKLIRSIKMLLKD